MAQRPPRYYVADLDSPSATNLLSPRQPVVQAALSRAPTTRSTFSSASLVSVFYSIYPLFLLSHILLA